MKKSLLVLAGVVIILASCVKENNTPTTPIDDTVDTMSASLEYVGDFMNGPYGSVSGMARIYQENGKFILSLLNLSSSNGPDLHVYLSKEVQPVNFIDLGSLKSTNGNQLYDVPGSPDFMEYKYALVHCKQFNHLFGSAALQ